MGANVRTNVLPEFTMRPLFWPSRPARAFALARPPRDILLAGVVAAGTVTVAWTSAMVAAILIMNG
jgi:hypothetical protein